MIVIKTPSNLFAFSRMKALPKYSPILFGVKILTEIPDKTAFTLFENDKSSIFFIKYFHFSDSIPQLIKTNRNPKLKRKTK